MEVLQQEPSARQMERRRPELGPPPGLRGPQRPRPSLINESELPGAKPETPPSTSERGQRPQRAERNKGWRRSEFGVSPYEKYLRRPGDRHGGVAARAFCTADGEATPRTRTSSRPARTPAATTQPHQRVVKPETPLLRSGVSDRKEQSCADPSGHDPASSTSPSRPPRNPEQTSGTQGSTQDWSSKPRVRAVFDGSTSAGSGKVPRTTSPRCRVTPIQYVSFLK
ncbi:hypothetical protein ENSA5_26700 [Enhygromyxa salina]|uniref:Uncharacterized protein n=1 Tax=Enhygromyxa salina TaxID=215803 RepID=A0A2S9YA81_9BACT|nr:hypothetical protein ENSA5_26700 [Enhygromyxa salina]